ncbi:hypothetical protein HSTV2_80 [Halorubrum sodomense tailed virus 2]|uniref:Uncharacterized protein n=1 Tax=Halorubrum sodomense tailed virus 2 TaxID=1262527 RepID=L7TNB4_9CAUD|nr:hypothetical protein HSTV2_80 [Halorubrum sodomense tailed virus 2]AGC34347.1 hypothetical protein HSTV2_80 [Halorubrum sodomense tailed virus 2]
MNNKHAEQIVASLGNEEAEV